MTKVTEVKRKANVGERIKIVNPGCTFGDYGKGDEMRVTNVAVNGVHTDLKAEGWPNGVYVTHDEYVVLETKEELPVNDNITVLADESIGGVLREYREVERRAEVGERIKIVKAGITFGHYKNGDVILVTKTRDCGAAHFPIGSTGNEMHADLDEYVTLEPTDLVRIEDVRYRLVERKAAVGDRVLITKSDAFRRTVGSVRNAVRMGGFAAIADDGRALFSPRTDGDACEDYLVLEPVESAAAMPSADLAKQVEGLTEAVAKLANQLRVAREDIVLVEEGVQGEVETLTKRIAALEGAYKAEQEREEPSLPEPIAKLGVMKSTQQIRDEIVERAKADVAELERTTLAVGKVPTIGGGGRESFYPRGNKTGNYPCDEVNFHINRNKRAVVANIRYIDSKRVWARGIAKCAPDDCFNVHIGKAIALRRALGLEVPEEYVKAPQPTEPRVGDVVDTYLKDGSFHMRVIVDSATRSDGKIRMKHDNWGGYTSFDPEYGDRIIDDSRAEDATDGPAEEVRAA